MKAYSIFDDFSEEALLILQNAGVDVTVHPLGVPRPDCLTMKAILEEYDCVIIGTSQKISADMFENVCTPKIIATASVGVDHIYVPEEKLGIITILNTPDANTQSVAEYNVGAMLMARKRFVEGTILYSQGMDNKKLVRKPEDIHGATIGFVGAGRISTKTMELLRPFGASYLCYSDDVDKRRNLVDEFNVKFVSLQELARNANIISINVPSNTSTHHLINADIISAMKEDTIFISIARDQVVDLPILFAKAEKNPNFYCVLDLDVLPDCAKKINNRNIIITPHIAGGTIETRKRMFREVAENVVEELRRRT